MTKKQMESEIIRIREEVWEIKFSEKSIEETSRFELKYYNKWNLTQVYNRALYAQKLKRETGKILKFI